MSHRLPAAFLVEGKLVHRENLLCPPRWVLMMRLPLPAFIGSRPVVVAPGSDVVRFELMPRETFLDYPLVYRIDSSATSEQRALLLRYGLRNEVDVKR